MIKTSFKATVFFLSIFMIGCGASVQRSIQKAVSDNQNAKSKYEWEKSDALPELLFGRWRDESKGDPEIKKTVCKELGQISSLSLTIFENEIQSSENAELLADCKDDLQKEVEGHYAEERATLEVPADVNGGAPSSNRFSFPLNIQKRDLSAGYLAVTGDVRPKEVILTFDDGPSGIYTESILRSLKEVNAKVIFFHLGKSVLSHPEIVKKVAADGHAIGTHSVTHACLGTSEACRRNNGRLLSFDEAVEEIKGAHQAVVDILGWVDPFFRFPYGESSKELKSYLARNQVGEFYWSIDSEDWKAQSNQDMIQKTLAQLDSRGRGIVLFHDIQRKTAESLPQFLKEIYRRGYSVVLLQAADSSARYNSPLVRRKLP